MWKSSLTSSWVRLFSCHPFHNLEAFFETVQTWFETVPSFLGGKTWRENPRLLKRYFFESPNLKIAAVDGSEIRQKSVDMVNISLFYMFFTSPGGCLGFLNHQQYNLMSQLWEI